MAGLIYAAALVAGCGLEVAPELSFVGLTDAPCGAKAPVYFGSVPVMLVAAREGEIQRVTLSVDAGAAEEVTAAPFLFQLDTTGLKDGNVKLEATGYTAGGERSDASLSICVDNEAPTVTVLSPADGLTYGLEDATLTARVRATDLVGLEQISARLVLTRGSTSVACTPASGPDATCTLSPAKLGIAPSPGVATSGVLMVTARDRAGHEASDQRTVKFKTRLLWSFNTGSPITFTAAAMTGDKVAVGTDGGKVYVLDASGAESCYWTAPAGSAAKNGVTSDLAVSKDGASVYFTTVEGLHALSPDCAARWSSPAKGLYFGSRPLLDETAGLVYVGAYGSAAAPPVLSAHALSSGASKGTFSLSAKTNVGVGSSPVLSADGKQVYIGSSDYTLYAVDVSGGPGKMSAAWTHAFAGKIDTRPLLSGSSLYVASYDAILHALDTTTGKRLSGFTFKAGAPFLSSPAAGEGGVIYLGSLDEVLYALDSTGKTVGSHKLGRMLHTSPVVGGGQVFAAATKPARLHVYDKNLTPRWYYQPPGGDQFRASPLLVKDTVYIGNTNGTFYALDTKTVSP